MKSAHWISDHYQIIQRGDWRKFSAPFLRTRKTFQALGYFITLKRWYTPRKWWNQEEQRGFPLGSHKRRDQRDLDSISRMRCGGEVGWGDGGNARRNLPASLIIIEPLQQEPLTRHHVGSELIHQVNARLTSWRTVQACNAPQLSRYMSVTNRDSLTCRNTMPSGSTSSEESKVKESKRHTLEAIEGLCPNHNHCLIPDAGSRRWKTVPAWRTDQTPVGMTKSDQSSIIGNSLIFNSRDRFRECGSTLLLTYYQHG